MVTEVLENKLFFYLYILHFRRSVNDRFFYALNFLKKIKKKFCKSEISIYICYKKMKQQSIKLKNMITIRIGQKVLDLQDLTQADSYELESGYEVKTFQLDEFEFIFNFEVIEIGIAYCDFTETEEPYYECFLTDLIKVLNLDTDEEVKLSENDLKLVLATCKEKFNGTY